MTRIPRIRNDFEAGFSTGAMPNVTDAQFRWLCHRMGSDSDQEACEVMDIDLPMIEKWLREDEDFGVVYEQCRTNKREAFKFLTTQLLPKTLLSLAELLDSDKVTARLGAANLILRTNGLLIDKVERVDSSALSRLFDNLRQKESIEVLEAPYKELADGG